MVSIIVSTHNTTRIYPAQLNKHLIEISQETHPVFSEENSKVGDYILDNIPSGYSQSAQEFEYYNEKGRNIFAYLDNGFETTRAIATHYDSVSGSFGAGDAGTAVASQLTLLEHWKDQRYDFNILIIFVDGEEGALIENGKVITEAHNHDFGSNYEWLLGSRYFVENYDQEFGNITHLYNFEGRGTGGRLILFESLGYSGEEIVEISKNLPVLSFSVGQKLYEGQPNLTDVNEYKKLPNIKILNFAFIGEYDNYHTSGDTYKNVDTVSKSDTYNTMKEVLNINTNDLSSNSKRIFLIIDGFFASFNQVFVQILALLSFIYLVSQVIKIKNYYIIPSILILSSAFYIEYSYIFVLAIIAYSIIFKLRKILGKYYSVLLTITSSLIIQYSFVATILALENYSLYSALLALTLILLEASKIKSFLNIIKIKLHLPFS